MNDIMNYFLNGSCGSFKKSVRAGWNDILFLFLFLCLLFILGKILAIIIHFIQKEVARIFIKN